MKDQTNPKSRGRPRQDASLLNRELILSKATQLMAAGAADVSMRAIASALQVNAMALYHYFGSKQALRNAMVEQAFAPLLALRPRLTKLPTAEQRLRLLADTYLHCAATALPLTRHLVVRGGAPLATAFGVLFDEALGNSRHASATNTVRDVLVDYLHGVALAGPRSAVKALEAGWPVLMEGVRRHLEEDSEKPAEKTEEVRL